MTNANIYVDEKSNIPLMGVDFIGIIDRGTNVLEIKPLTLCNLKCKYCFVNAGNYSTNFIVSADYLIAEVKKAVNVKACSDIEIHIAPYGEILLYPELYKLLRQLWEVQGIKIISMQSNGLLLSKETIKMLDELNLTRINISLNSLDEKKASYLCDCKQYNLQRLIENIKLLLDTNIDILIAPVWFPNENDKDIEEIIKFVIELRNRGYSNQKIQIGIQKYLIYKTGRKLKKIRPKSWDFFYKQLTALEKKHNIKLKLGPNDFGIHKVSPISSTNLKKHDLIELEIVSRGRWDYEYIGKFNDNYGIKVLLKRPLVFSEEILNKKIKAEIIKINLKDNILTALFPL